MEVGHSKFFRLQVFPGGILDAGTVYPLLMGVKVKPHYNMSWLRLRFGTRHLAYFILILSAL